MVVHRTYGIYRPIRSVIRYITAGLARKKFGKAEKPGSPIATAIQVR